MAAEIRDGRLALGRAAVAAKGVAGVGVQAHERNRCSRERPQDVGRSGIAGEPFESVAEMGIVPGFFASSRWYFTPDSRLARLLKTLCPQAVGRSS